MVLFREALESKIRQLLSNGLTLEPPNESDIPLYSRIEAGATDWTLLLQVDSDEELGMIWEEEGRIFFWIKKEDLAKKDFTMYG